MAKRSIVIRHYEDRHDELGFNSSIVAVYAIAGVFAEDVNAADVNIDQQIVDLENALAAKHHGERVRSTPPIGWQVNYSKDGNENHFKVQLDTIKINELP